MKNYNILKEKINAILQNKVSEEQLDKIDLVVLQEIEKLVEHENLLEQGTMDNVYGFHYDPRAFGCYPGDACYDPLVSILRQLNTEMHETAEKVGKALSVVENLLYVLFAQGIDEWYEKRFKPYGFASSEAIALEEAIKAGIIKKAEEIAIAKESVAVSKIVDFQMHAITYDQRRTGVALQPNASQNLRVVINRKLQYKLEEMKKRLYERMIYFDGWKDSRIQKAYQSEKSGNWMYLGLKRKEAHMTRPNMPWHETWASMPWSPRSLKQKRRKAGRFQRRLPQRPGRGNPVAAEKAPAIRSFFYKDILQSLKVFLKTEFELKEDEFISTDKMYQVVDFMLQKHRLYDSCPESSTGYCGYDPGKGAAANKYGAGNEGKVHLVNKDRFQDLGLDVNPFWSYDLLYILKRFWRAAISNWSRVPIEGSDGRRFHDKRDAQQMGSDGQVKETLPPVKYIPHVIESLNDPSKGFFDKKELFLIMHMKGTVDQMNALTDGLVRQITQNVFFVGGFFISFGSVVATLIIVGGCIGLSYLANKYGIINLNPLDPEFLSTKSKFQELLDKSKQILENTIALAQQHPQPPETREQPYINISAIKKEIKELDLLFQRWNTHVANMFGNAILSNQEAKMSEKMEVMSNKFRINVSNVPGFEKTAELPETISWDQMQTLVKVVDGMNSDLMTMNSYFTTLLENMPLSKTQVGDFQNYKLKTDGYFGLSPERLEPAAKDKPEDKKMHKITPPSIKKESKMIELKEYKELLLTEEEKLDFSELENITISENKLKYPGSNRSTATGKDPASVAKAPKTSSRSGMHRARAGGTGLAGCMATRRKTAFRNKIIKWEKLAARGFLLAFHGIQNRHMYGKNFGGDRGQGPNPQRDAVSSAGKLFNLEGLEHIKPTKDGWKKFVEAAKEDFERSKQRLSHDRTGQPGGKNPVSSIKGKAIRMKKGGKRTKGSYIHTTGYVKQCGSKSFSIGGNSGINFVFMFGIGEARNDRGRLLAHAGQKLTCWAIDVKYDRVTTIGGSGAPISRNLTTTATDEDAIELCSPLTLKDYAVGTKSMKKASIVNSVDKVYQYLASAHNETNKLLVDNDFNKIMEDSCYSFYSNRADALIKNVEIMNNLFEAQIKAFESVQEKWLSLWNRLHSKYSTGGRKIPITLPGDNNKKGHLEAIIEFWASVLYCQDLQTKIEENYYNRLYDR